MKHLFIPCELSLLAKEKGFNEKCLANYSDLSYPTNDSGNDYDTCLCLWMDCQMPHDEVRVLWIENKNADFHWHEGLYTRGEHSRCELTGETIGAPLYQQIVDWFREKHGIFIYPDVRDQFLRCRIWSKKPPHHPLCEPGNTPQEAFDKAIKEAFKLIPS
jgi:hypothetical protein